MMHAMLSETPGGPESLRLTRLPLPQPGPGEVRIAVQAAGVNFPDTIIIRDLYQFKPPRPFAPGGEVAGVIDAVGSEVSTHRVGDRVVALPIHGGFVSHICVHAEGAYAIPSSMPFDEAACFLFTYGTSYYG
ncbi:MAG: alcohol dehydrogenase catalytic domain-containing protein, partial [Pseudomonadota bacterium]